MELEKEGDGLSQTSFETLLKSSHFLELFRTPTATRLELVVNCRHTGQTEHCLLELTSSLELLLGISCILYEDSLAPVAGFLAPVSLPWMQLSHRGYNRDTSGAFSRGLTVQTSNELLTVNHFCEQIGARLLFALMWSSAKRAPLSMNA
ncbi:hypothetical protein Q8A73_010458 [Channa argus]|nr:hypothetical protein Q8A73_010458 [Channa argus]